MQETKPKKGKPAEIPVPKRKDVLGDLGKVAKPKRERCVETDAAAYEWHTRSQKPSGRSPRHTHCEHEVEFSDDGGTTWQRDWSPT